MPNALSEVRLTSAKAICRPFQDCLGHSPTAGAGRINYVYCIRFSLYYMQNVLNMKECRHRAHATPYASDCQDSPPEPADFPRQPCSFRDSRTLWYSHLRQCASGVKHFDATLHSGTVCGGVSTRAGLGRSNPSELGLPLQID